MDTQKLLAKSDDADLRRKIPTHGGIVCSITLHKMEPNFKVKECSENIHPFRYFSSFLVGVGILKSLLLTLVEGYILVWSYQYEFSVRRGASIIMPFPIYWGHALCRSFGMLVLDLLGHFHHDVFQLVAGSFGLISIPKVLCEISIFCSRM